MGPPLCFPLFFPLILPPSEFPFVERDRNGPTSLMRGEGRLWVDGRGWERAGVMVVVVGEEGEPKINR